MLSRRWRGAAVEVVRRGAAARRAAPAARPEATAVPIDLDLGALRALVISGPNTGGKTVALKTLGLAALLHQSGLRPPARGAALPVFDHVLADIGDQQSIEMSLSTFSGHVAQHRRDPRCRRRERSLVLLDELASGTDPVEGSALAQALLARLAEQARLTRRDDALPRAEGVGERDARGSRTPRTGFDPETHAPLYRIALGRPGTSHALQIAERLGLDAGVVDDAARGSTPERLRVAGAARRGGGGRAGRRRRARGGRGGARRGGASERRRARARGKSSRRRSRR